MAEFDELSPESEGVVGDEPPVKRQSGRAARKARLTRFSDMSTRDKVFRVVTLGFSAVNFLLCVSMLIRIAVAGEDPSRRLAPTAAMAVAALAPLLFELIFCVRLSWFIQLTAQSFILVAGYLGVVENFNNRITHYDKACHCLFGYIACFIGLFVLLRAGVYHKAHPLFIVIVIFSVSMALSAVWELYEFACDRWLGMSAQGSRVVMEENGEMVASVMDTMRDILVHFIGTTVFIVQYVLHRVTKKSLGILFYVDGLSVKKSG